MSASLHHVIRWYLLSYDTFIRLWSKSVHYTNLEHIFLNLFLNCAPVDFIKLCADGSVKAVGGFIVHVCARKLRWYGTPSSLSWYLKPVELHSIAAQLAATDSPCLANTLSTIDTQRAREKE